MSSSAADPCDGIASASGMLVVVSAPSGTGKTTVVEKLVKELPGIEMSRSYTSRAPNAGETPGVDYNFISRAEFEVLVRAEAFLEWAEVYGNFYGTRRSDTETRLATGCDLVLVIDVQGARLVRQRLPGTVAIFVLPPSFAVLEQRLRGRSRDPEDAIQRRLRAARSEVSAVAEYDYVVVNDDRDRCVAEMRSIVLAERARLDRRRADVAPIVATFDAS